MESIASIVAPSSKPTATSEPQAKKAPSRSLLEAFITPNVMHDWELRSPREVLTLLAYPFIAIGQFLRDILFTKTESSSDSARPSAKSRSTVPVGTKVQAPARPSFDSIKLADTWASAPHTKAYFSACYKRGAISAATLQKMSEKRILDLNTILGDARIAAKFDENPEGWMAISDRAIEHLSRSSPRALLSSGKLTLEHMQGLDEYYVMSASSQDQVNHLSTAACGAVAQDRTTMDAILECDSTVALVEHLRSLPPATQ